VNEAPAASARWRVWVLVLSFLESFATILLERGMYFFSHERLGYSEAENLWLAAGFGLTYAVGAASSHVLARRIGDRATLACTISALTALHVAMQYAPSGWFLTLGFVLVGLCEGAKWPVVESYVACGLGPAAQLGAVGRFNISWAAAVPLALVATGPIVAHAEPRALFGVAAVANVLSLTLLRTLPRSAPHLDSTHPSRPEPHVLDRYRRLLGASRWCMLASYSLLFLLAPLLPGVFERLGASVTEATAWASGMDTVRLVTFVFMASVPVWQGRRAPLFAAALGLPLGFVAISSGGSLALVLAGEVAFGVFAGLTYHAALYYALVVKNAAVHAGGAHESLIGLGLVLGPVLGLLGRSAAGAIGNDAAGVLAGASPLILACWFGSWRELRSNPNGPR
jgi:hypothetical protein